MRIPRNKVFAGHLEGKLPSDEDEYYSQSEDITCGHKGSSKSLCKSKGCPVDETSADNNQKLKGASNENTKK